VAATEERLRTTRRDARERYQNLKSHFVFLLPAITGRK